MTRFRRSAAALAAVAVVAGCGLPSLGPPRDPNVRGAFGEFMWARGAPTRQIAPIDPAGARDAVDRAATVIEPDHEFDFPISIVATFDGAEQAEARAEQVRDILEASAAWYGDPARADARAARDIAERMAPLTPPEEAALRENLLAPGDRGFGWGGSPGAAEDAVYSLGPVLFVIGLESDSFATHAEPELHPLAHLLAAKGAEVLVEGDRFGEGSIVADISCQTPDPATATRLLDEVGDAVATAQYNARPPWVKPEPTAQQALARATYRRWLAGYLAASGDSRTHELFQRIGTATSTAEREAATRALTAYLKEKGLKNVEGEVDLETMRLLVDQPEVSDADAYRGWTGEVGERMGRFAVEPSEYGDRPSWDDTSRLLYTASVRVDNGRLEMGWAAPGRFAAAMPYLAAYLAERGCSDLRIATVDFDEVRGD